MKFIRTGIVVVAISMLTFIFLRMNETSTFYTQKNKEEISSILEKEVKVVYFYSDSCSKCIYLKKSIKKSDLKTEVFGVNVGEEKNKELIETYGITSTPTILIFSKGKGIKRMEEIEEHKEVIEFINENIK